MLYRQELDQNTAGLEQLPPFLQTGRLSLIYAARDSQINHAVVLQDWLEMPLKDWARDCLLLESHRQLGLNVIHASELERDAAADGMHFVAWVHTKILIAVCLLGFLLPACADVAREAGRMAARFGTGVT